MSEPGFLGLMDLRIEINNFKVWVTTTN